MMVDPSTKKPSLWGFDRKANKVEILASDFTAYTGEFKQTSGAQINIDWKTYDTIGPNTGKQNVAIGCSSTLIFDGMLTAQEANAYGFKLKGTNSAQCNDKTNQPDKIALGVVPIDESFSIIDLSGKKLSITGTKDLTGKKCDKPIVIEFSTESNGSLTIEKVAAADPVAFAADTTNCGSIEDFGWGQFYFGDINNKKKIQAIDKTTAILMIGLFDGETKNNDEIYEQIWMFKTKGLDPKIVVMWASNWDYENWTDQTQPPRITNFQFNPPNALTYTIK